MHTRCESADQNASRAREAGLAPAAYGPINLLAEMTRSDGMAGDNFVCHYLIKFVTSSLVCLKLTLEELHRFAEISASSATRAKVVLGASRRRSTLLTRRQ